MNGQVRNALSAAPFKLEFDLLLIAFPFVFDGKGSFCRNMEPLAGNPNGKRFALFQAVGQPAQLGCHLLDRVAFFNIPFFFFFHFAAPITDRGNSKLPFAAKLPEDFAVKSSGSGLSTREGYLASGKISP
jgi:hypothetical protein